MSNALAPERCYGVDVLKTLSMFMVVVLHVLGQGGVLNGVKGGTLAYWAVMVLQIGVYCSVNCFALATGYLMVGRKVRYRKLLPMWLTVAVYSVLGMLVGYDFNVKGVSLPDWLFYLCPVLSSEYWYFTAYVCLYLLVPYLNQLVNAMTRRQHRDLLILGFLLCCVPQVANVTRLPETDLLSLSDGYGMFWLMYLYFLGAGMKKYGFFCKLSTCKLLAGYILMAALTFLTVYVYNMLPDPMPGEVGDLIQEYGSFRFISYLSPTIVAEAVFLSVACINWRVPNWMRKPLVWLSPLIFQVYIIHTHPIPFSYLWNKLAFLAEKSTKIMVISVLGYALGIFLVCIAIDWVRFQLFCLLRVSRWTDSLAQWTMEKLRLTEKRENNVL